MKVDKMSDKEVIDECERQAKREAPDLDEIGSTRDPIWVYRELYDLFNMLLEMLASIEGGDAREDFHTIQGRMQFTEIEYSLRCRQQRVVDLMRNQLLLEELNDSLSEKYKGDGKLD